MTVARQVTLVSKLIIIYCRGPPSELTGFQHYVAVYIVCDRDRMVDQMGNSLDIYILVNVPHPRHCVCPAPLVVPEPRRPHPSST